MKPYTGSYLVFTHHINAPTVRESCTVKGFRRIRNLLNRVNKNPDVWMIVFYQVESPYLMHKIYTRM